jgi:hypothetical protein
LGYDGTGTVTLFDLRANTKLASFTAEAPLASFALSSDAGVVAIGDDARRVHILRRIPEQQPNPGTNPFPPC